jgi:hypothetical protein
MAIVRVIRVRFGDLVRLEKVGFARADPGTGKGPRMSKLPADDPRRDPEEENG